MSNHHITGAARIVAARDLTTPAMVLVAVQWSPEPFAVYVVAVRLDAGEGPRLLLVMEDDRELDVDPDQPLLVIEGVQ